MNEQSQPTTQYEPVNVDDLSGPQLVGVYNQLVADKDRVKKFETLGKGRARVKQALSDAGLNGNNLVRSGGLGDVIVLTNRQVAEHDPTRVPPSLKAKPLTDAEVAAQRQKSYAAEVRTSKKADEKIFAKAEKNRTTKFKTGKSQAQHVVDRLKKKGGATIEQLVEASSASVANVRWYLSQHVKKKLGLNVVREGKVYRIDPSPTPHS